MEKYNQFKSLVDSLHADAVKFFEKGNASAGTRLRKGLQKVKGLAHELRKEISNAKSEIKKAKA